jgi:hypothetical protein
MQLSLLAELDVPAERLKYEAFKEANPWVIERLTQMCYALYNNGHNHYGIGALVEVLRFQHSCTYDPNSDFKFNNNYRAFMAREIMQNNPMLEGFFSTRKSVADLSEDY